MVFCIVFWYIREMCIYFIDNIKAFIVKGSGVCVKGSLILRNTSFKGSSEIVILFVNSFKLKLFKLFCIIKLCVF